MQNVSDNRLPEIEGPYPDSQNKSPRKVNVAVVALPTQANYKVPSMFTRVKGLKQDFSIYQE